MDGGLQGPRRTHVSVCYLFLTFFCCVFGNALGCLARWARAVFNVLRAPGFIAEAAHAHHEAYRRFACSVLMAVLSDAIKALCDCSQAFCELWLRDLSTDSFHLLFFHCWEINFSLCFVPSSKAHYGWNTIRATVEQEEALHRRRRTMRARESPLRNSSDLRLAIYTPSTFEEGSVDMDDEATESEIEEAADMSFELEDESDPENYEDEEGAPGAVDLDDMPMAEHETMMDISLDVPASVQSPMRGGYDMPMTITICSDPPPLPRISSIRIDGMLSQRQLNTISTLGTSARNHEYHRGPLTREYLRAQALAERSLWRF